MSFGFGMPNPLQGGAAVTLGTPFGFKTKALYVGGAGNVAVTMADGTTQTFTAVPVGTFLPICCTQVNTSGTTASNMVALY